MTENPYQSPSTSLQAAKHQTTPRQWLSIIPLGAVLGGVLMVVVLPQINSFVMGSLLGIVLGTVLYAILNLVCENWRRASDAEGNIRPRAIRWRLLGAAVLVTCLGATAGVIVFRETMRGVLVPNFYYDSYSWHLMKAAEVAAIVPGVALLLLVLAPSLRRRK